MSIQTEVYKVEGMTCAACARSVETYLSHAEGIRSVSVNFADHSVQVAFDPEKTGFSAMDATLDEIGFGLAPDEAAAEAAQVKSLLQARTKLIVSALLSLPLMALGMFFMGVSLCQLDHDGLERCCFGVCRKRLFYSRLEKGNPFFRQYGYPRSCGDGHRLYL